MIEVNNQLTLSGTDVFCPQEPKDTYRVEQGDVFVYIVPWVNARPGRRVLLCEVSAAMTRSRTIPAFVYRDLEYKNWRFALVPKSDEVVLTVNKNSVTSVLHQKFLKQAGLDTYAQEGFEGSLAEFYKREILKDDAYIAKGQQAEPRAKAATYDAIKGAFKEDAQMDMSGSAAYQALQFVCGKLRIPLIKSDEMISRCGKDADIMDIARASRFICRKVVLEPNWCRRDCGALVSTIEDEIVACVPGKSGKYQIFRSSDGSIQPLTEEMANQISPQAYSIGRTLPIKPLTKKDVIAFCGKSISLRDMGPVVILALVCALIGVLLPTLNQKIYDDYIPLGDMGNLGQLCVVMLSFMIGNLFFSVVKNLFDFRVTSRIGNDLQNAVYHRLFHLPESFFRNYDSADLGRRVMSIGSIATGVANTVIITGISALFSIVYFIRMCRYSGKLSWIGIGMYAVYMVLVIGITSAARKRELAIAEADAEASSKLYQYLNGVDKIRMAGVEDRALLSYMQPYARQQSEEIKVSRLVSAKEAITCVISSVFSMVLYLVIVKNKINLSVGTFVAFNSAFGAFTGALESLVEELLGLYQEKDMIDRFWPVFTAVPEDDESKEVPGDLSGGIALEHVKFAYEQGGKLILNDLSLNIKPGEYVGIVGSSGCGKSTLLKLLLGFETPQSGIVMVDGKDLRSIDKSAYRRQLGVVLQNGKLISGSIYENITITAPHVKMARVNEVINQVGLREDINQMPMGIHTVLSENSNTISGGQQQRILIARAIVGSPSILIFDEATSALDNITQAAVSSNLDKMNVTRIVVAHRLSTIKNCNRILVLKDGSIAEEGNYESLMARRGLFYELASRQIAE